MVEENGSVFRGEKQSVGTSEEGARQVLGKRKTDCGLK